MDEIIKRPHKIVLDAVSRNWSYKYYKGFWQKLFELGEIKPVGIEIVQTDTLDERTNLCTGKTLNRWRYDDKGLQVIPLNTDTAGQLLDHCSYCIDKDKRKLAIVWENIFPGKSSRKNIHYINRGEVYQIVECDGVQDFELISCWIE